MSEGRPGGRRVAAIHQPDFLPWLGVFDKIAHADVFVYLDHVRSSTTQIWGKRVRILVNGRPHWLTVPLVRSYRDGFPRILDLEILPGDGFAEKHLRTLDQSYGKLPGYPEIRPLIERFYVSDNPRIAERNVAFIEEVCLNLGLRGPRIRSSTLDCRGAATDLLIEITRRVGCDAYLCGGGAGGYQRDEAFPAAGLELIYQRFVHPVYPQGRGAPFVPGLSVIDAVAHLGFGGVRRLVRHREIKAEVSGTSA
jgi:hypothetical protein